MDEYIDFWLTVMRSPGRFNAANVFVAEASGRSDKQVRRNDHQLVAVA